MTEPAKQPVVNSNPDYQDRDIQVKPIVYFLIGLTVLTVVAVVAMALLFFAMDRRADMADADIPPEARARVLPPEPRLQVGERMVLDAYLAKHEAILRSYAVSDEDMETVRIPIDRAIDLVAERGLPRWGVTSGTASVGEAPEASEDKQ